MPGEVHQPVLLTDLLAAVRPQAGQRWVDGTFGRGGHARAFLTLGCHVLALDRDAAGASAAALFSVQWPQQFHFQRSNFKDMKMACTEIGWDEVQGVLLDLGVSSPQLDAPERGFSFRHEAPLDMRMDQRQELTAARIIHTWSETELADLFYQLGDEHESRRIARTLVRRRVERAIATTTDLAEIVARALPHRRHQKTHAATKVFQALRMAVNDERTALLSVLPEAARLLASEGVLAVISFHSGEDRLVKNFLRNHSRATMEVPGVFESIPNPDHLFERVQRYMPSETELEKNPRARSARLRVAWKKRSSDGFQSF